MKPSDDLKKAYPLYVGKDAQTIDELVESCGLSRGAIETFTEKMVGSGRWKRVVIRNKSKRICGAYVKVK